MTYQEVRHQHELNRDVIHCAVRYLTSKKVKSAYEREMLEFALEQEKAWNECLLRGIDF